MLKKKKKKKEVNFHCRNSNIKAGNNNRSMTPNPLLTIK